MLVITYQVYSKSGLAMAAIRDDEVAAEALGVKTFRYKIKAPLISSFLAELGGGLYAYQHVSYYYDTTFELTWSFIPTLTTFIGGLGTIAGPIVGSTCFIALNEIFAISLGNIHVLVFGLTFILIVQFFPGGLMSVIERIRKRVIS